MPEVPFPAMSAVCPACGQEHAPAAKFCSECGAALPRLCTNCGAPVGAGRFCSECGVTLSATPATSMAGAASTVPATAREPEGERKQLTVLFADVQGSMELQEELDVEAWARIVDRFVGILVDEVHRFGGTVDKFTGDGIMALFGALEAQEDHARRACHAAWQMGRAIRVYAEELHRSEGVDLRVRVGLNSGEAMLAPLGGALRIDATVAHGHTVGLAQRMEAMAVPGCAYLTEHTARLVEGWFRLQDLGPKTVKGAREPIRVFALEGPAPPRSASGARVTSRLVGRASEIARLEEALNRAAEGRAQVVGVVGEPGVGKSRLCDEFARSVLAREITLRRAAGVSHGREVPLLPILAFLRDYFGITEADNSGQARERISDRLLALDPGFIDDLPLFFDFLEVPDPERPAVRMAAESRMRRLFEAIRRVTARRSEREVLVLVFEDLHWFDTQSAAFLERLIENFPGSRTLVVANFRPEFSAAWMRHSYYQQLSLTPLSAQAVGEMLRDLLGNDASLLPLPAYLVERTGGNPFFVEEVVRALVEDGTLGGQPGGYRLTRPLEKAHLPPSVQSVLAARIDRLAAENKPVLQSAAVIGRTFGEAVLARVMDRPAEELADSLSALCAAELLQEVQNYPVAEYRFWHPLTQEVAYGMLLAGRRTGLHAAVAEALIEHDTDHLDEAAAVVAWHWERAGRRLEAARWNMRAADFALRSDLGAALRRWRATVDHLDNIEDSAESLTLSVRARTRLIRYGARTGMDRQEVESLATSGRELAARAGDPSLAAAMELASGGPRFWAGEVQAFLVRCLEAVEHAEETDDLDLKAGATFFTSIASTHVGPLADGLAWCDRVLEISAGSPDRGLAIMGYTVPAFALVVRAGLLLRMGRLGEAARESERAQTVLNTMAEPEPLCWALAVPSLLTYLSGEGGDTSVSAQKVVDLAQETGNAGSLVVGLQALAIARLVAGQPEEAAAACERALAVGREKRTGLHLEASIVAHLAQARLTCGDPAAAAAAADEAVEIARRQGARVDECLALLTRAHVGRVAGGGADTVVADLNMALTLASEVGALTYEPFIHEELGRLRGDETELRQAVRLYEAIGATGHARRLATELEWGASAEPSSSSRVGVERQA